MAYGSLFSTQLINAARFDEAVATADREIAATPDDPEPYFNRGRAYAGLNRWDAAVDDYGRALQRDAQASAADPAEIDDELFFALRQWAAAERERHADTAAAMAVLDRYAILCPEGRHLDDLAAWRDRLRGFEKTWVREQL